MSLNAGLLLATTALLVGIVAGLLFADTGPDRECRAALGDCNVRFDICEVAFEQCMVRP